MNSRFVDDSSDNGFNVMAKKFELVMSMVKLFPLYLEKQERGDMINQTAKPDYSGRRGLGVSRADLHFDYEIYHQSKWTYPRIYSNLEELILNHVSQQQPAQFAPDQMHFTPFVNVDDLNVMLVAKLSKIGILKGVSPASSGFDEDIAEMYNEKILGINGKVSEKSEGKFAVFLKGLKVIYTLDIRDVMEMV